MRGIIILTASLVPRLSRNTNMYRLHNFNVRVPERGSLGTRLPNSYLCMLYLIQPHDRLGKKFVLLPNTATRGEIG